VSAALRRARTVAGVSTRLDQLESAEERTERTVREELAKNREEATGSSTG
jgi:hypothetical protein